MEIPLKKKYRHNIKTRYPIHGDHQGDKHKRRHKLGHKKHVELFGEPRKMVLVLKATGGRVFREVE
jgi:hypothetical protein